MALSRTPRWPPVCLAALVGLVGAGCMPDEGTDRVVAVAIRSPVEMPFHGPNGPGTEPIYIDFSWTVVVTTSGLRDLRAGLARTRLTEAATGVVLTTEDGPLGTVPSGGEVELRQHASGVFPSSRYPGDWRGVTTVEISGTGGRSETLTASFTFR